MKRRLFALLAALTALSPFSALADPLRVVVTHPLLGDLTRQVGGDKIVVVDLLKAGGDIHHFEPTASDLTAMRGAKLVLASGKHLEGYLPKIQASLGAGVRLVEVGKPIPSLKIAPGNEVFMCCPEHAAGSIDPHWWHSAENMARAAKVIATELAQADPANAAAYKAGGVTTAAKMTALKKWAQQQLAAIPTERRKLVTAHAAFGYFCKEYGFQMVPLLGLAREDDYSPKYIATAVAMIKEKKIGAIFPEDQANPKMLQEISRQTGVKVGKALIADGTAPGAGSTFEGMLRHNVGVVLEALAEK